MHTYTELGIDVDNDSDLDSISRYRYRYSIFCSLPRALSSPAIPVHSKVLNLGATGHYPAPPKP